MKAMRGQKQPPKFRRPKDAKKTILRLLSYLLEYKYLLVLVLFFVLISSLAGVVGTYFLKTIIDDHIIPISQMETPVFTGLYKVVALLALVYLSGVLGTYLYNRIMMYISTNILKKIRCDLFSKMQRLPIKFFDSHPHGELMSRFTNDIDTLREMIGHGVPHFFSSLVSVTGVFIMMVVLSPYLTILVLVMLFIMINVVSIIGKKSAGYFRNQQKSVGALNGYVEETVEGQKVVKVFCHESKVVSEFEEINNTLRQNVTKANTCSNILMPIMGNLSYMHYALTAVFGAILYLYGLVPGLGTIASFLQYTRSFSQPITQLSQQFNSILSALAGAERVFGIIDETPEVDNGNITLVYAKEENGALSESDKKTNMWAWKIPEKDGFTLKKLEGEIVFKDVVFSYEGEKIVLNNISLYAKKGQKIAFVGSTGAGKTTITNLINRFYEIEEGTITYDGINIKDIKKDDLRSSLSVVLQDTHLFTGTVADNIRYGKPTATDEEVKAAAKLANAHFFISHLPKGYDTVITGDGANLSQGQRQLISIARAAIADTPLLILDEATSSIDTRTEALIEKGMDTLMQGRTVFVIAHRLSTVRNSNAIMVLEKGEIIERGDHDDLLLQKGKYYQLYHGMFELE